ncbi:MAG: branched-chain amino acid ABC transporter permease [Alphaproteobacteria bacterium]|nr:branched-chain amino acid ABC transporter permease [Alphaproteobacteria bacterium]|tara:strand:+ start:3258 stop:4130 length:873 start_codon:yes stop_codon:yes gene_type:complete
MEFLLEVSLVGLAIGGVYALIAVGYALVYRTTRVVNFAHGNMMMFGAYFFFSFTTLLDLHWSVSIILTLICAAVFGAGIERILIRPLLGRPAISVVMVSVGLAAILHGAAQMIWSAEDFFMPQIFPDKPIIIEDMYIPSNTAYGFLVAIGAIGILAIIFRFTRSGIAMRAAATDQIAATSMGINVPAMFSLTWIYAALTASLAGIVVGSITTLNPSMGLIGLSVLAVVILGGLDSIFGAVIAGLIVGWIEAVTGFYIGAAFKDVVPFIVLLAILIVRPHGLFGTPEIERL